MTAEKSDRSFARQIGARIRAAREKAGLSQYALADRLPSPGHDQTMVSRWEAGERMPTAPNIAALAQALDVSSDYLLGISGSTSPGNPDVNLPG